MPRPMASTDEAHAPRTSIAGSKAIAERPRALAPSGRSTSPPRRRRRSRRARVAAKARSAARIPPLDVPRTRPTRSPLPRRAGTTSRSAAHAASARVEERTWRGRPASSDVRPRREGAREPGARELLVLRDRDARRLPDGAGAGGRRPFAERRDRAEREDRDVAHRLRSPCRGPRTLPRSGGSEATDSRSELDARPVVLVLVVDVIARWGPMPARHSSTDSVWPRFAARREQARASLAAAGAKLDRPRGRRAGATSAPGRSSCAANSVPAIGRKNHPAQERDRQIRRSVGSATPDDAERGNRDAPAIRRDPRVEHRQPCDAQEDEPQAASWRDGEPAAAPHDSSAPRLAERGRHLRCPWGLRASGALGRQRRAEHGPAVGGRAVP